MLTKPGEIAMSSIAHLPSERLDLLRSHGIMPVNSDGAGDYPQVRAAVALPPAPAAQLRANFDLWAITTGGAIGAVNQAALDLTGFQKPVRSADDLIGQPLGRFFADRQTDRQTDNSLFSPGVEAPGGQRT